MDSLSPEDMQEVERLVEAIGFKSISYPSMEEHLEAIRKELIEEKLQAKSKEA